MSYNIRHAYEIAEIAKKCGSKVLVGGPHFSIVDIDTLKQNKNIDAVVRGEGEKTLLEYILCLKDKTSLRDVEGLTYCINDKIYRNRDREFIEDIDSIPSPAWDLVPMNKYRYFAVLASRGCPFRCVYCASPALWKSRLRLRSPQQVVEEIRSLYKNYDSSKVVHLKDDTFTMRKSWAKEICKGLNDSGFNIRWECMGRVNTVDIDLLKTIKKANCQLIEFGIESGNEHILKVIKKDINLPQIRRAIDLCQKVGLRVGTFFMLGHPRETKETMEDTFNLSIALRPDCASYSPCDILPGTELEEIAKKEGVLAQDYNWAVLSKERGVKYEKFGSSEVVPGYSTKKLPRSVVRDYALRYAMRFDLCRVFTFRGKRDFDYLLSEHVPSHFFINNKKMFIMLLDEIQYASGYPKKHSERALGALLLVPFLLMLAVKHANMKLHS